MKAKWQVDYFSAGRSGGLSLNALHLLESRYLRTREDGQSETAEQLFRRVAHSIAQAELAWGNARDAQFWEARFFEELSELKFLPNSPTLMNAGTSANQLSACFVLPVEDSLEGILSTLKLSALIQQSGGGTGFNFSKLRERGAPLGATSGTSSGPVSFIQIFDATTEHIRQGGKRRGANIGILNVDHPDILAFINCKSGQNRIPNFNLSVGVRNAFMQAVERRESWKLVHPKTGAIASRVDARVLWDAIIENAWQHGDPGLIFLDAINEANPTPAIGSIEATNPCGEVPLLPYESCNLGSVNLSRFVSIENRSLQWPLLEQTITCAIRFLDNVIEANRYPSPEIESMTRGNRKIGLGVMGWAEALSLLEIPYDSTPAVALAGQVMQFIAEHCRSESQRLAAVRGVFLNWKKSKYYPGQPLRHATCTSIAPTGSISVVANTSSSIEPYFAMVAHRAQILERETWQEVNPVLMHYLAFHQLDSAEVITQLSETGTLHGVPNLPPAAKEIFKTALEIDPQWHLAHQRAFQQYTDNAVSKTINLPHQATREDIARVYENAWKLRLKGITVYRDRSKPQQVLYQGAGHVPAECRVCGR